MVSVMPALIAQRMEPLGKRIKYLLRSPFVQSPTMQSTEDLMARQYSPESPVSPVAMKFETVQPSIQPVSIRPFPSLKYDIASKKRSIALVAIITFAINGFIPAVIYYIVRYGTSASRDTLITVVEISATFTVLHWPWRLWLLLRRKGERAPRDRHFLTWDHFQWTFLIGVFQVTAFCVLAGIFTSMRWFMFAFVSVLAVVSISFFTTWLLARNEVHIPFQVSSVPAGSVARPALYGLIEDITACDGGGGQAYRERLNVRWESSPAFRKLVMDLTLFSAIGVFIQTCLQFIVLFATPEAVFVGLSTVLLWGWFGLTLLWGWKFAEKRLREEKTQWESSSFQA
ncbi:hypothetical protein Clacol_001992 [Clathrus columnatus]|uniref:Uncharacterized protein n=1 Tax=Clathrus columnatus TaxID=1419009 RepID=A0AAV4ZZJ2_9AGAM|nr:hypothetical protein Clacol_001992 [Clathrus columnatus]